MARGLLGFAAGAGNTRRALPDLVAAGVARSRSDALAWCVRLVQRNTDTWLTDLRDSLEHVERVRAQGPDTTAE